MKVDCKENDMNEVNEVFDVKSTGKKIHPLLVSKLKQQKETYEKVTALAEILPMYSRTIINNEFTLDYYCQLDTRYKTMYLAWGINWYTNIPTNYPEEMISTRPKGLINIYINCYSLFGDELYSLASHSLYEAEKDIKCHFYDSMNSNFYFSPEELPEGLEKLHDWYVSTKAKIEPYLKQKKKEELEKQLKELE